MTVKVLFKMNFLDPRNLIGRPFDQCIHEVNGDYFDM